MVDSIKASKSKPNWIPVGAGYLALWHRPRRQYLRDMAAQGANLVVVTLLHADEDVEDLGRFIQQIGLAWFWLPLSSASPPEGAESDRIVAALPVLSAYLDAGRWLLLHCSAGLHRTGMVAYALLRWRGYTAEQTLEAIAQSRPITRAELTPERMAWGERVVGDLRVVLYSSNNTNNRLTHPLPSSTAHGST